MKSWVALPVLAVALGVGLLTAPSGAPGGTGLPATAQAVHATVSVQVRVAEADRHAVMTDACVFSAEAMAAGAPPQCGGDHGVHVVHATFDGGEAMEPEALVWPGDILKITATAALAAWDATITFVDSVFGYAKEQTGLDI